mmetsp:Transcript_26866/g.58965  ORF Transcript_26866/g.58965 Transcript_26866/m.58965 type:complete len:122 (+) Transcript_26866:2464-2829(+)
MFNTCSRLGACGNRQNITTERDTETTTSSAVNSTKMYGSQWSQKCCLVILESMDRGLASIAVWSQISVTVQNARSSKLLPTTFKKTKPIFSAKIRSEVKEKIPERSAYERSSQRAAIHNEA